MTPEGRVKERLRKLAKATGAELRFAKWIGRNGCPDCFIWWPGWSGITCAFVETKALRGKFSVLQQREIAKLRLGGFIVYVPYSEADVDSLIIELTQLAGCAK